MAKIIRRTQEEAQNPENKILLFAPNLDQAYAINAMLKRKQLKSQVVSSRTPGQERREYIEDFEGIF